MAADGTVDGLDGRSWVQHEGVLVTDLDDELVLLVPTTRAMFTLNETGRVVWQALETGTDVDGATDAVVAAFAVDRPTARRDVAALLGSLVDAGLVHGR